MKILIKKLSKQEIANKNINNWPIWTCEKSTFNWEYGEKESCLIIEGSVTIKTNYEIVNLLPGDFVIFPKGLKCKWDVIEPIKKHYTFE